MYHLTRAYNQRRQHAYTGCKPKKKLIYKGDNSENMGPRVMKLDQYFSV